MLATPLRIPLCLMLAGALGTSTAIAEETPMPPRQILLEKTTELPANPINAKIIRVSFPRGFKTPLHTHEGPGPRYIVQGKVRIDEGGQVNTYGPGEVFWESGQWMTAENVGDEEAVMIIFELAKPK